MKEFNGPAEIDLVLRVIDERTARYQNRKWRPFNSTDFWKRFNADQQKHLHSRLGYIVLSGNFDEHNRLRVRDQQLIDWGSGSTTPSPAPAEVNAHYPNAADLETLLLKIAQGCDSGKNYTDSKEWERLFSQGQRHEVYTKLEELFLEEPP